MNKVSSWYLRVGVRRAVCRAVATYACLFVLAGAVPCYAEEPPTAQEAVAAYRQYLAGISDIAFDSLSQDRDAEQSDAYTNALEQSWKIDVPGKRLWRTTRTTGHQSPQFADVIAATYSESLLTPQATYEIVVDAKTKTATKFSGNHKSPEIYWPMYTGFGPLSHLFGYVTLNRKGYQFLPDMLDGANAVADASGKVTLVAETDGYRLTVRLDPAKGWMADRIHCALLGPGDGGPHIESCDYEVVDASRHGETWLPDRFHQRVVKPAYTIVHENIRVVDNSLVKVRNGSKVGEPYVVNSPRSTGVGKVTLSNISVQPLTDADFQVQANAPKHLGMSIEAAVQSGQTLVNGKLFPKVIR